MRDQTSNSANHQPDDEALARYLANEATTAEVVAVETWIKQNPELGSGLQAMHSYAAAEETNLPSSDTEKIWSSLSKKLVLNNQETQNRHLDRAKAAREFKRASSVWKTSGFGIGGSQLKKWATIGIGVSVFVVGVFNIKHISDIFVRREVVANVSTYSTVPGQRATVNLTDGSTVILAPSTVLRVSGRNVELSGEAVFTVIQHTNDPFTVRAGGTLTRVLGTTFGVRAYDDKVRIAVSDGRVSVNSRTLSAGDIVRIQKNIIMDEHGIDVATLFSWTAGRLVFDRTPAADVANELERWYGAEILLQGEQLTSQRVTAVLEIDNRQEAIGLLASVLNARAVTNGNRITLIPISQ